MKRLHILRAGTHTDSAGRKHTLTATDIASIADRYDPVGEPAPLVVGHPKIEDPAYGWVAELAAAGDDLEATPKDVDPAFAELVESGRYRKISVRLYGPDAPANPKPGGWYLGHVGFLGAHAPSVKGLRPVELAETHDTDLTVEIDLAENPLWPASYAIGSVARMLRRFREWVIADKGEEAADRVMPNHEIDYLSEQAAQMRHDASNQTQSHFTEPEDKSVEGTENAGGDQSADLAETQAENARLKQQLEANAQDRVRAEADAVALELAEAGRIPPAQQKSIAALIAAQPDGADDASADFADPGSSDPATPRARLVGFLRSLPEQIVYRELTGEQGGATGAGAADFNAPAGAEVGSRNADLHKRAKAYQAQHNVSYAEAIDKLAAAG